MDEGSRGRIFLRLADPASFDINRVRNGAIQAVIR